MPSKPDRAAEAILAFSAKTEEFIGDLLREASARGFCKACAMNFVAHLVVGARQVVHHESDAATDELFPTDFDDTPGHA